MLQLTLNRLRLRSGGFAPYISLETYIGELAVNWRYNVLDMQHLSIIAWCTFEWWCLC